MPTQVNGYRCDTCKQLHESEENASMCEAKHASGLEITEVNFEPGKEVPESILVRWTDHKGNERGGFYYP